MEPEEVGSLMRAARDALKASRARAAAWVGVSEGTIQDWETATSPNALRVVLYLRRLARDKGLARNYVLQILGLRTEQLAEEPGLEHRLALVRAAYQYDTPGIRSLLGTLEVLMHEVEARSETG